MSSQQQVVVVSGGSRGLGQALVADFLRAGHIVATFSRSCTPFIETCRQNDPGGRSFYWQSIDATAFEELSRFAATVASRYQTIDILVNNSATVADGILTLARESDIHRQVALNLEATIHLTRSCLKTMLRQQRGCVINISSVNATRGHAGVAVYSATKAALDGFTRALAVEFGPQGIRVNSVAPGYFHSELTTALSQEAKARIVRRTPLGRLGSVDDVLPAVRFLASAEASFITGQVLAVDGGISC